MKTKVWLKKEHKQNIFPQRLLWSLHRSVQILGGYGYTKDFPVERYYRDSKLCTIGEGTSEIQKLVISKQIIK